MNCHSAIAQKAGVDLHDCATGYATLAGRASSIPPATRFPLSPLLYSLMRGKGSLRMPPDEPLPEADIDLIGNWITAGANND